METVFIVWQDPIKLHHIRDSIRKAVLNVTAAARLVVLYVVARYLAATLLTV